MQVPAYIAAQLGGSISACFALRVMLNAVSNTGITIPSGTALQALAMEVVVSFVLMFVTSAVATDSSAVISYYKIVYIHLKNHEMREES